MNHHTISSTLPPAASDGRLLFNRAAFPRIKATESCWKSLWMVTLSSSPFWRARALPSLTTSAAAEGCQAPKLSAATGVNTMPCLLQASQDLSSFLEWAVLRAWPGVVAAPLTSALWRGLMTVTSKAVSFPPDQCGIRMSAGLPSWPGNRKCPSFVGARAAATAVLWRVSLRLLCCAILSPCSKSLQQISAILI